MRNFNESEKKVLTQIVEQRHQSTIQKLIQATLFSLLEDSPDKPEVGIEFDTKTEIVKVYLEIDPDLLNNFNPTCKLNLSEQPSKIRLKYATKITSVLKFIVSILSVIDYLEKNHLVYLYEMAPRQAFDPLVINRKYKDELLSFWQEIHLDKRNHVFETLLKTIFPTPELEEFVKNGFKDREQLQHEENVTVQRDSLNAAYKLGTYSIIVAVLSVVAAVIGIFVSLFS